LTFILFRGVGIPPTSNAEDHLKCQHSPLMGPRIKNPHIPYIRIPAWGLRRGFVADSTESSDADDRRCSREALWQAGKRPWHGGNEDEEKVEFPVGRWEMCNTLYIQHI